MRQVARPSPSGLNSNLPVAPAKEPRGNSPQLNQPAWSASSVAPVGNREASLKQLAPCVGREPSSGPLRDQLLGLGERLGGVQPLGADVRAVHDRVAAIEAERIVKLVEPLASRFIAAVGKPSIGLEQHCGTQELVAVPPVAGAAG